MLMNESENYSNEDSLLLQRMQEGDGEAFAALYEKYWEQVYSSAYKRLKDKDAARDITQDVFMKLWTGRDQFAIRNLPAYLHVAVRNKVLNWLEKEQKYVPVPDLLLQSEAARDQADAELLRKEFFSAYEKLVASLTSSQQAIFRMRYQHGLSTEQIAEKLYISRKTVQNQLGKSVARLKGSLLPLYLLLFFYPF